MQELPYGWLADLASAKPTPGGGGAAAVQGALGAALVSMVCNLTIGKKAFVDEEPRLREVLAEADALRIEFLELATADAEVFDVVIAAYKLPKADDAERQARTAAIQAALVQAAAVPLRVAGCAAAVIALTEAIVDGTNPNVASDVAVAAASAAAALTSASVNVEVNLSSLTDAMTSSRIAADLAQYQSATAAADTVVATVRQRLSA